MNRRTFLTGLLSTAAAVSTAPGVAKIAPSSDAEILALLQRRWNDCYALMARQMNENLFGNQQVVHTLHYCTDEAPVFYQGVQLFFDQPRSPNYEALAATTRRYLANRPLVEPYRKMPLFDADWADLELSD